MGRLRVRMEQLHRDRPVQRCWRVADHLCGVGAARGRRSDDSALRRQPPPGLVRFPLPRLLLGRVALLLVLHSYLLSNCQGSVGSNQWSYLLAGILPQLLMAIMSGALSEFSFCPFAANAWLKTILTTVCFFNS